MGKRLTDRDKWKDKWFRKLSPSWKCIWEYCLDSADAAGVFELDQDMAEFCIQGSMEWGKFEEVFKNRILPFQNGGSHKHWLPAAILFQNGKLDSRCPPHRRVIDLLHRYGLYDEYQEWLAKRMPEFCNYSDQTEMDDLVLEEEAKKKAPITTDILDAIIPTNLDTPEFRTVYGEWMSDRKERKKPITPLAADRQLKTLAALHSVEEAICWLDCAIEKGWQGLYAPPQGYRSARYGSASPTSVDPDIRRYALQAIEMIKSKQGMKNFWTSLVDKFGKEKKAKINREVETLLNNPKLLESDKENA